MTAPQQSTVPLAEHAVTYTRRGLEVFPCKPDKSPYTEHGNKDATTDEPTIRQWWRRWPDALIAGRIPERYVVLDVDPRYGGADVWAALEMLGNIDAGRIHRSGGTDQGCHYWFQHPGGKLTTQALTAWARDNGLGQAVGKRSWTCGIDILRYEHRYSILPPSPHPDTGRPYEWVRDDTPGPMPRFLATLLTTPATPAPGPRLVVDNDSIADWYTANHSWHDILPALGWVLVAGDGDRDGSLWRHPNATAAHSASVRHGCLFVYTPNSDFDETEADSPHGYTRFRAWATVEHGSDMRTAARAARDLRDGPTITTTTIQAAAGTDDSWDDPIPLGTQIDTPPFPVDQLPDWMRPHIETVADEHQVAVDLPATIALAVLAAVNAKRYRVHVKATWYESVNLYLVVALPPSAGKSPVFRQFTAVVQEHERALRIGSEERVARREQKRRMIEKRMKRAEDKGDDLEALNLLDELLRNPAEVLPRLLADDITVEALVDLLATQGGRIALMSTEGGLFDQMAGRYSDKSNLDPYLQAWSGDTIRVDRIGRGHTIVEDPLLTVGLTVQPTVIEALADRPEYRGRGLTARFMYSMPDDFVGQRDLTRQADVDPQWRQTYDQHVHRMLTIAVPTEPATLRLDTQARTLFLEWRQQLEAERTPHGELAPLREWSTKLESSVVRLAGLLHVADGTGDTIGVATMQRALTVGGYWLDHARLVHDLWGSDETVAAARVILKWVCDNELDEFSARDVYRNRRGAFPTAEDTRPALMLLIERGWIKPLFDGALVFGRRGVESPKFAVHPSACGLSRVRHNHGAHVNHGAKDVSKSLSFFLRREGGEGTTDMVDMVDMNALSTPTEGTTDMVDMVDKPPPDNDDGGLFR